MKKILSTALALGLVTGITSTASAAYDSFKITGHYKIDGTTSTNMDATNGVDFHNAAAGGNTETDTSSAWMTHRTRLYPELVVNDQTKLNAEIRLNDGTWGQQLGIGSTGATNNVNLNKLWMTWGSPMGTVKMGSIAWGSWGTAFADTASTQTGIVIVPNMISKPMNMVLVYGKLTETDSTAVTAATSLTDQDRDYYELRLGYKTDTIDTQFGLGMDDDRRVQAGPPAILDRETDLWRFRGYGKFKCGTINIDAEFDHLFGDTTVDATNVTTDRDSWAAYLEINTKIDVMTVGAISWYVSGDNDTNALETSNYGLAGNDFEPLLITTGDDFGLFNGTTGSAYNGAAGTIQTAGQIAVGVYSSLPVSDKLTFTTIIASAWADEEATGWDDHYGTEININMDYNILDNLTYSVSFGYLALGDWFDQTTATADDANVNSVTMFAHTLNMTF